MVTHSSCRGGFIQSIESDVRALHGDHGCERKDILETEVFSVSGHISGEVCILVRRNDRGHNWCIVVSLIKKRNNTIGGSLRKILKLFAYWTNYWYVQDSERSKASNSTTQIIISITIYLKTPTFENWCL